MSTRRKMTESNMQKIIEKMSEEDIKNYLAFISKSHFKADEYSYRTWRESIKAKEWVDKVCLRYAKEPLDDGMTLKTFLNLIADFLTQYEISYEDEGLISEYKLVQDYIKDKI